MASFSSSEISNMISSKKYRIKKGDTLSLLTEKFQNSFPSAKCVNKSDLQNKIYNTNKSAFGGNKNILLLGKELDLKFLCDCRCHFKIDKSKKDYVFTNEDRLIASLKGTNYLWDDFCKCDKELGSYMKQTFSNIPSSSLPKSMPMPIKLLSNGTSFGKKILGEIQKRLSGIMVTTNQIAEEFYKMIGKSASNSEINNLALKLEKENNTCRHSSNCPCSIPKDKIEKLSVKCMNTAYCSTPLNNKQLSDMEKGFYQLSPIDGWVFITERKHFWERLIKTSGLNENEFHKIRQNFGLQKDKLEGDKIFFPSKKGLKRIDLFFGSGAVESVLNSESKKTVIEMALYSNYLGADIKKLVVTSTKRTIERQAELMLYYLKKPKSTMYPTVRKWLETEKQSGEYSYYKQWEKGIITEREFDTIAKQLSIKHIKENPNAYGHVSNTQQIFDIGPNSSGHTGNTINYFNKSIEILEETILDKKSKLYGEGGEKAYHIVLK